MRTLVWRASFSLILAAGGAVAQSGYFGTPGIPYEYYGIPRPPVASYGEPVGEEYYYGEQPGAGTYGGLNVSVQEVPFIPPPQDRESLAGRYLVSRAVETYTYTHGHYPYMMGTYIPPRSRRYITGAYLGPRYGGHMGLRHYYGGSHYGRGGSHYRR